MLVAPIAHVAAIDREQLNRALVDWGHKMGAWNRPAFGQEWFHGLYHNGQLVAVTGAARLISERVSTSISPLLRTSAFELGRLCASRPHLCRATLRLWRELIAPGIADEHGFRWVVSYQDAVLHRGDVYRFDGWVELGRSSSGTDARSGRTGRRKVIWGWAFDPALRAPFRKAAP
ncbi:MAG: hypothetical protein IM628_12810 [Phenylobacterium sp.]|uniref:hypothetical protein n=1 Tax=Phenylobacterium sp. TaxID=1871053 RepID=UPI0025CF2D2C|nr:hypothetical protein [Phenylobacterium sp.]MCA6305679.1 hypothetical protein [Phenylobacterium sp.]